MNQDRRSELLYRILADSFTILINNKKYIIKRPTRTLLCDAQLEYNRILSECKFMNCMRESDCLNYLVGIGKWLADGDDKIKQINQTIEDQQVALYNAAIKVGEDRHIRLQLKQLRILLNQLYETRMVLHSFTDKGLAQQVQQN